MTDRLPPHSEEAEKAVIGCILADAQKCLPEAQATLRAGPASFYDQRNKTLYGELLELSPEKINLVTVGQWLKDLGKLEQCGGYNHLAVCMDAAISTANLPSWLEIVLNKYTSRKVIQVCVEAVGKAYESVDVDGLVDWLECEVLKIRPQHSNETPPVKKLASDAITSIEEDWKTKGSITGLPTGLIDLDKYTDGLHGGQLIIIAAHTSRGKTALAMNIAENLVLNHHLPVGVFTLEMTAMELVKRMIGSHARVNLRNVKDGYLRESDFPKLANAASRIGGGAFFFDDNSDLSVYELRARARRMVQKHDIALFVVDYLQLLNAAGGARKIENRQGEVADISRSLKQMAKEFNVPVIALSQLNDDGMLRESRAIGQDADGVWIIEAESASGDHYPVKLKIKKNRSGPRDVVVDLTFLASFTRFESQSRVQDGENYQTQPDP